MGWGGWGVGWGGWEHDLHTFSRRDINVFPNPPPHGVWLGSPHMEVTEELFPSKVAKIEASSSTNFVSFYFVYVFV